MVKRGTSSVCRGPQQWVKLEINTFKGGISTYFWIYPTPKPKQFIWYSLKWLCHSFPNCSPFADSKAHYPAGLLTFQRAHILSKTTEINVLVCKIMTSRDGYLKTRILQDPIIKNKKWPSNSTVKVGKFMKTYTFSPTSDKTLISQQLEQLEW